MSREEEDFRNTLKEIERIVGYKKDMATQFGQHNIQPIMDCIQILRRDLDKCTRNEEPSPTSDEVTKIKHLTDLFLSVCVEKEITEIFKDLSIPLMKLAFNWNVNTTKCPDIERNAKAVDRIVRSSLTVQDSIWMMRRMIDRARATLETDPPAFSLARHYLKSIEKKQEESS